MSQELGLPDLVAAAADAWRWRDAVGELRDWHHRRYELLRLALGVDVDVLFGDLPDDADRSTWELARDVIIDSVQVPDPFGGLLEAPEAIIAIYQRHTVALTEQRMALARTLREVASDALAAAAPDAVARTTTIDALCAAGLPASRPDPIDFL